VAPKALTKEEAVRLALAELGDVPASDLAAFVERRCRLKIDPRFLPIFKAVIRAREREAQARAQGRAAATEGGTR
jgi:hypothetical protein